jgi:peroxiredoxin
MTAFGEQNSSFTGKNAQVLGISMDDLETQKRFAESLASPFPLLADPSGKVAKAYGVHGGEYAKRVTFVIGKDGKILEVISGRDAIDPAGALNACSRGQ